MKNYASIFLLFLIICSCTPSKPSISGSVPDAYDGLRIYLKGTSEAGYETYIDTAVIFNEKFDFGEVAPTPQIETRFLEMDTGVGNLSFLSENEPITINVIKDSLEYSTVSGGDQNKEFDRFRNLRNEYGKAYNSFRKNGQLAFDSGDEISLEKAKDQWAEFQKEHQNKVVELVTEDSDKMVALIAIDYLFQKKYLEATASRNLYNKLDADLKNNSFAKRLDQTLIKLEATSIGGKAPYFEGKNPDDMVIKLPETLGKVTLIDFWASWCAPCRQENPNIVAAYQKYHAKGLNIISVSLDKKEEKDKWIEAIKADGMDWYHISRLQYFEDPIAALYNVNSIPASFLLDENGVIIAKDLRGPKLEEKLAQLLD